MTNRFSIQVQQPPSFLPLTFPQKQGEGGGGKTKKEREKEVSKGRKEEIKKETNQKKTEKK